MTETDKIIGYEIDFFPEIEINELYKHGNKRKIDEKMLPINLRYEFRAFMAVTDSHQKNVSKLTIMLEEPND